MRKKKIQLHLILFVVWISIIKAFKSRPYLYSSRWWIRSFDTKSQIMIQTREKFFISPHPKSTTTELFISSIFNDLSETLTTKKETEDDFVSVDNGNNNSNNDIFPFVIQRIERTNEKIFREISEMCIETFFNEDTLLPEEDKGQGSL